MRGVTLESGRAVHVKNHINAALRTLFNDPIEITEIPFAVFVENFRSVVIRIKISVPERNAHAVKALCGDIVKVIFGYPVVLICVEKLIRTFGAESLNECFENVVMILHLLIGRKPVLLNEP